MPKKHRARWGYRLRPWFPEEREPYFSKDVFQDLCEAYSIPHALKDEVYRHLEDSADIYHTYRNNRDDAPRPAERKAALEEIASLATELHHRLDNLDDFTATHFWRFEAQAQDAAFTEGVETTDFGHQISRRKISDEEEVVWWETPDVLVRSVQIIRKYAELAAEGLPEDQGGPRRLEGLRMWTGNMFNLWEKILGRRFTLDYLAGEPVSDAARFCVAALQPVDPEVPTSRVISAMRRMIRDRRQKTSRNMPSQN